VKHHAAGVWTALAVATAAAVPRVAQAGLPRFCDQPATLTAAQQARLLRVSVVVKDVLERSGQRVALVSRSGLDLDWLGLRYSHSGYTVRDSTNGPWSVRQLYYACDAGQPRLFDQGLSGFLFGTNDPERGALSLVFLPPDAAERLERAVLDTRQALALLGATYSANAHAWSQRYQNCNQWTVELFATAQGDLGPAADRTAAQQWLQAQGYAPSAIDLRLPPLLWLVTLSPWLHHDDHPPEDLNAARFQISMPASIEAFIRATVPGATRIEVCHAAQRVVVHHGWTPIADGCHAGDMDTVVALD
jgi:hypothetical protein